MQKLAKREEEYMHALWSIGRGFIRDIINELPDPKPHYNTVATIIKILEEKGFVDHESIGNSNQYYPLISKESYQQSAIGEMVNSYFDNSYLNMVSFFAKKEKISAAELESIINMIKKSKW